MPRRFTDIPKFFATVTVAIALGSFVTSAHADTINADSCSRFDVQEAVDAAVDGDTVVVPAGSCTWSDPLTVTHKGITIRGAGVDETIITDATEKAYAESAIAVLASSGDLFRITGFTFNGTAGSEGLIGIRGSSQAWRIDNNKFDLASGRPIAIKGHTYGVIDHNTIEKKTAMIWVATDGFGDSSWSTPIALGSPNAVYIEDNVFDQTRHHLGAADAQAGGRFVFRYNTLRDSYVHMHGSETGYPERGGVCYEIYGNNFIHTENWFAAIFLRGGTGVAYDNTATGYQSMINVINRRSYESHGDWGRCDGSSSYDGNEDSNGYPCYDQFGRGPNQSSAPFHEWENYLDGENADVYVQSVSTQHIQEDRDYFNDTQLPGYTPYTYPHPLTTVEDEAPPTVPNPPANLRIVSG